MPFDDWTPQRGVPTIDLMPEQPDNYDLTDADIEMLIEETTGKPIKPASLEAGLNSMRRRIAQLQSEKENLLNQLNTATKDVDSTLKDHLAAVNKDLVTARERLAHYQAQLGKQN